ncbi:MAG TPA: glycosyltransferase family 4 protein [Candidatus Bipolaricaulota bacterium]|nr:glycosyltransferase family 4 protein [Candidatus Bipolaricaulota bacterium]
MEKTLLVTLDFPPRLGGVANYWANLCGCLPADSVSVLAPEYEGSHDFDCYQNYLIYRRVLISRQKWLWPKWLPMVFAMQKLIRKEKIKRIIVGQVLPVGSAAYLLRKFFNFKYIVSCHGTDVKTPKKKSRKYKLMRCVLRAADCVIANSEYTKKALIEIGVREEKINIIYPCPNVECVNVDQALKNDISERYNLKNKKILLTVARLVERKGHDKVIQALAGLTQRFPDLVYLIVGKGNNLGNLKALVNRFNLKKYVLFLDRVDNDELKVLYDLADIFIMASRELSSGDVEGFGIVYLEANNFKKPVIAGKSGGAVESVIDGVNGLLVDPNNFHDLSRVIVKLLKEKDLAERLGENGYRRNREFFSWSAQAEKLCDLLK